MSAHDSEQDVCNSDVCNSEPDLVPWLVWQLRRLADDVSCRRPAERASILRNTAAWLDQYADTPPDDHNVPGHVRPFHAHPDVPEGHAHPSGEVRHRHLVVMWPAAEVSR